MKVKITKLKDQTIQELDVAIYHYLSEEKIISFDLRGGRLQDMPEKTLYSVMITEDDGVTEIDRHDIVTMRAYNFTVDAASVYDMDGTLIESSPVINNSISFIVA